MKFGLNSNHQADLTAATPPQPGPELCLLEVVLFGLMLACALVFVHWP
jgi:hypothetical protein